MVAALCGFPAWPRLRPHVGPAPRHRYERRRPEKTPLHKIISENLANWLEWRDEAERPVPGYVEDELRGYLECGILCFGFARAVCMSCRTGFVVAFSCKGRGVCPSCNGRHMAQTAAHLADHVIPPVPVRQWVISVPKRLRGMLADRPRAVAALTRIFLDEIERLLCAAAGLPEAATTPSASRPRLGAVSFLHRFGSTLNHHVHLHVCATEGVFVPAADGAGCDASPAFLPARPINQADLAALTERVRRRVIRWFRMQRLLDAAAAADMLAWENSGFSVDASVRITLIDRDVPSYFRSLEHLLRYCARPPFALERLSVSRGPDGRIARIRGVCTESQTEAGRHRTRHWEHWQAARGRDWRACGRRTTHGRLLRHSGEASFARHLADCVGETHGPGGGGVSTRVPSMWRRHPADRIHHGAGADPQDSRTLGRTTRATTGVTRSWPAHRLGRVRAGPR